MIHFKAFREGIKREATVNIKDLEKSLRAGEELSLIGVTVNGKSSLYSLGVLLAIEEVKDYCNKNFQEYLI